MKTASSMIAGLLAYLILITSAQAATFPSTFEPRRMSAEQGWFYTGSSPQNAIGGSYSGIGDINADGYDDLIVGTGNWAETPCHYLLYGGADRGTLVLDPQSITPADGVFIGDRVTATRLGDFNGVCTRLVISIVTALPMY